MDCCQAFFFSNDNANFNTFVTIKHKKDLVKNGIEAIELSNKCFVNAIDNTIGIAPFLIGHSSKTKNNSRNTKNIIYEYSNFTH